MKPNLALGALVCVAIGCGRDRLEGLADENRPHEAADAACGNGVLDAGEACDTQIAGEGGCSDVCLPLGTCFTAELTGVACARVCKQTEILAPIVSDGCCPRGAAPSDDSDCGLLEQCGNGVVDTGEACDTGITQGSGACPAACSPSNACSSVALVGYGCARRCEVTPKGVAADDTCCPGPMFAAVDNDCAGMNVDLCPDGEFAFDATEMWHWEDAPFVLSTTGSTTVTPLVAQFTDDNGDGGIGADDTPDVLVVINGADSPLGVNGNPAMMVLLSGDDGRKHWSLNVTPLAVVPYVTPALGDLDGDGLIEIVTAFSDPQDVDPVGLIAFEHTGVMKWKSGRFSQPNTTDAFGGPDIVDIDGDGTPEIVFGNRVVNADGTIRWEGADIDANENIGRLAIALDLGGPPGVEVIDGGHVYTANGDTLWEYAGIGFGNPTVADCDLDGKPEILLVATPTDPSEPSMILLNAEGEVVAGTIAGSLIHPSTPGAAGDLDGDGKPEFVVGTMANLFAVDCSLSVVMTSDPIVDYSGASGPVLFDFDGNGALEIVHGDEWNIMVFDGGGKKLWSAPRQSLTGVETPAVADIDGDGHAEILAPQSRRMMGTQQAQGVIAYRSAGSPWMGTLPIWNQHAFRALNIFADGTVPYYEGPWWQTFNAFRATIAVQPSDLVCP